MALARRTAGCGDCRENITQPSHCSGTQPPTPSCPRPHPPRTAHLNEISAVVVIAQLPPYGPIDLPPVPCQVTCDKHLGRVPHNWEGVQSQLVRTHTHTCTVFKDHCSHFVLFVIRSMPLLPAELLTPTVLRWTELNLYACLLARLLGSCTDGHTHGEPIAHSEDPPPSPRHTHIAAYAIRYGTSELMCTVERLTELNTPPLLLTRKQELSLMHAHCSSADMVDPEADRERDRRQTRSHTAASPPDTRRGVSSASDTARPQTHLLHYTWSRNVT